MVREIQISYFLILVMMSKTQIHCCVRNMIIDMYMNTLLPLGHCLKMHQIVQGLFSGPYVMSNHAFFLLISWKSLRKPTRKKVANFRPKKPEFQKGPLFSKSPIFDLKIQISIKWSSPPANLQFSLQKSWIRKGVPLFKISDSTPKNHEFPSFPSLPLPSLPLVSCTHEWGRACMHERKGRKGRGGKEGKERRRENRARRGKREGRHEERGKST